MRSLGLFSIIYFCLLCFMQGSFRSVWRFFYFVFSTAFHIAEFFWAILWGEPKEKAGPRVRNRWLAHVPHRLGLRMRIEGTPFKGTCLYIGNHISYIDPITVLMQVDAHVVAKAEVLKWPLVGYGAYIVGTIFVQRDEKDSRRATAHAIQDALMKGMSILVYPEGTTSAGPGTLPFRPRSFEAAHLADVPVQPIAVMYDSDLAAYIGNDTFLPHFFRLFRMKHITGRVVFGPILKGAHTCEEARQWIEAVQASYIQKEIIHEPA